MLIYNITLSAEKVFFHTILFAKIQIILCFMTLTVLLKLKLKLKFISQVMIHIIQLKYMFKNSPCRTPKKGVNAQAKFGDLLTYT